MAMAAVSADDFVPRLEEKHEELPEKKQKKTDEERQEEEVMELKSSDLDRGDLFPLPGCRFSPTDDELVAYHLLGKATKRKFPVELIAEVDVYKFAPWKLADESIVKGDLTWYFFCPIEKKYLSGIGMNRTTDVGYWKITGKVRDVLHNNALVGSKKTLVFYKGKASSGERTGWVMHEYRLDDKYRAERGVAQNEHVLCKIYQKEGLGYGYPFKEEDWIDDNYLKQEDRNDDEKVSFGLFTPPLQCDGTASEPYSSSESVLLKKKKKDSVLSQHVVLPAVQSTNVIPKELYQVFGGHDVSFSSSVVSNEDENDETLYTRDFKVMELKRDLFPLPGCRFCPTDVELVMYYLLRKATKRKFPVELIAEVDVYKYAPWKLADESIVKGDLIWYFFCPIEKKYSSGIRMNRATDVGYWKVTGTDRSVLHNNVLVGSIKTLIFYKGRAPKGQRTDWVMHEYRLDDKYRAERGVAQNEHVLCKIFQSKALGPRLYGSLFKEEDWIDDNYLKQEDRNDDEKVSFGLFTPTLQCDGTASEPYSSSENVLSQHVVLPAVQSTNVIPKELYQGFGGHDVSFSSSVVSNEDENDEDSFHLSSLTQMVDHGEEDTSMCSLNDIWSVQIEETSMPNKQLQEEKCEKEMASEPHGMTIDVEAFNMTDSSEASETRQPEDIQVGEMQPQALSSLKSQGVVFDVEVVNILKPGGQVESHIEDIEIEPESSEQLFLMQCGLGLTKLPKDEDWMNAKEIYLMDNELSVLPENPRCSSLLALFLSRNYKLRMIPPSFFDHMPALQILNLSKTGIKSLPDSLFRLVSLKRLFLNDCHRLMMLSPQVADLKQLEVLDLEGAKIMDLPKEIKKLTNLTCLEVSFYGYTSNGWRAMQSNFMVPCGVISSLSHLEELNIDVNPDDERWDARVKDIVDEICSLKRLETLKFYFPRVELLRHFQWNSPLLSHFRFTVGRHVKRIMSRVPPDVEFELEQWERYLKYINGVGVPRDIKNVLQHVTAFFLDRHVTVKKLSDFGTRNMKQLKSCVIGECNEVQVIIDAADVYGQDGINEIVSESYDAEQIVLGSLEYLYIYYMKNLRSIWEGSIQQNSLFLLKSLTLRTCPQLTTIFTQGLLDNLRNLEELKVEDCPSINSIVCCDISSEYKSSSFLPNLKKISLHYMPGLVSISGGLHIAPKLEWLSFYNCPNLKNPLIHEVYCQDLKKIKGERSWWEALEWSNGCPDYLEEIFVSIDI